MIVGEVPAAKLSLGDPQLYCIAVCEVVYDCCLEWQTMLLAYLEAIVAVDERNYP